MQGCVQVLHILKAVCGVEVPRAGRSGSEAPPRRQQLEVGNTGGHTGGKPKTKEKKTKLINCGRN